MLDLNSLVYLCLAASLVKSSSEDASESDDEEEVDYSSLAKQGDQMTEQPSPKTSKGSGQPLTFSWSRNIEGGEYYSGSFSITPINVFTKMQAAIRGQLQLFSREKEIYNYFKQSLNFAIRQKKISALIEILQKQGKIKSSEYETAIARAELGALVKLFNDSITISTDEIQETKENLEANKELGLSGFYVVVNKKEQADEIIQMLQIGRGTESTLQAFKNSASKYAKVKSIGHNGYPANERYVMSTFGAKALQLMKSINEGSCSQEPIKLDKNGKWLIFYLQERVPMKLSGAYAARYAKSKKMSEIITEKRDEMMQNGQLILFAKDSSNNIDLVQYLETNAMDKLIARIGNYKILFSDLYRLLDSLMSHSSIKEVLFAYSDPGRRAELNFFLMKALDILIILHIKASIARDDRLVEDQKTYEDYKDIFLGAEFDHILNLHIRSELEGKQLTSAFEEKLKTLPKARIKGIFISVETKSIADRILSDIRNAIDDVNKTSDNIIQLVRKKVEDFSVESHSAIDDRLFEINSSLGNLQNALGEDISIATIRPNNVYLGFDKPKDIFNIVYIISTDDSQDITYDEVKFMLIKEEARKEMDNRINTISVQKTSP